MDEMLLSELAEAAFECAGALCAGVAPPDADRSGQTVGDSAIAARVLASAVLEEAVEAEAHQCITDAVAAELGGLVDYLVLSPVTASGGERAMLFVAGAGAEHALGASALVFGLAAMTLPQLQALTEGLPRDQAMDVSLCGITIADARRPDMPLVYVNRTFCEMTGYDPEQLLGENCRLLQGDDRDQPARYEMAAAVAAGHECTAELRNYRRDGSRFDNQIKLIPIRANDGRLTHYVGVQLDVSERRALRELVGDQAQEFQRILDLSGAGALLVDATSEEVVFVNRVGADLLGRSVAALLACSAEALLGATPRSFPAAPDRDHLMLVRPDGEGRCVEVNAITTTWAGHELLLVTLVDVTERERTAEALRATDYLLDRAPDAVFWTRRDGSFAYVNRTAAERLGYNRAELMALRIPDIDPNAGADPTFWERHWAATAEQDEYLLRSWHHGRDGQRIPVEIHGKVLTWADEPLRASFVRDISERLAAEDRLRESHERLARAMDAAPFPIMIHAEDGRVERINRAWSEITGYTAEDLTTVERWVVLAYGGVQAPPRDEIKRLYTISQPVDEGDFEITCRDGSRRIWAFRSAPLDSEDHGTRRVISIAVDVTEARAAEQRLRQSARVMESTDQGVVITDERGWIVRVNAAFTRITGYSEAEVLGRKRSLLASGHQGEDFYKQMWAELTRTGHWQGELWNRRKAGEVYPEWLTINAVHDDTNTLVNYVGVFSDLTRIKRSEAELQHLAEYDMLTDLPNRDAFARHLDESVEQARRSETTVAVLLCDVDRFATFNESLGLRTADRVLCAIGERIQSLLPAGSFLARPGGDEFAVVLVSAQADETAARLAERLLASGTEPIRLADGEVVFADLTVGISRFPDDAIDAAGLLQDADAALHNTKATARGSYGFFAPELTAAARERLSTETELRYAIDNDELALYYHPLVDVPTGVVGGAEALVRWPRTDGSLVSPDRFIPLAEETGLIIPLGRWVLWEACRQARAWQQSGLAGLVMAVNVSGRQIESPGFLAELDEVLATTGLDAGCLELEITETVLMKQVEAGLRVIDGLHERGVRLAIDDFGTGYSSLAYLKRFGAHKLKIDRAFVRDLPDDADDAEIATTIIAMGHNLRMEVLAEGVETVEQLEFLQERGCDWFQGFWVSRPVPAAQFPDLAAARYRAQVDVGES